MIASELAPVAVGGSTVPEVVLGVCADRGEHVAFTGADTGERITFAELGRRTERLGAAIADRGFGTADTVAIWAPNSPGWLPAAIGAMAAGCAVTGISPVATDHEALAQLQATGASMLFAADGLVERATDFCASSTVSELVSLETSNDQVVTVDDLVGSGGALPDRDTLAEDDLACLPLSSGTTGLPKAVQLTHRNLVTMFRQIDAAIPIGPEDVALAIPPFPHVMGMVFTGLWPLSQGASVVTVPGFTPDTFVSAIAEHRPTLVVVPPMLATLLAEHPGLTPELLSGVRLIGFGGAPLPPDRQRTVATRFPRTTVGQGYGMTELSCVAATSRLDDPGPAGSVGQLLPNTEARVVDPDTGATLSIGATGELWLRGPQVMTGYLDDPHATANIIDPDGWLHTGDLARFDHDGYLFIIDRIKELIKVKGHQVAPAEVEQVLLSHPQVNDAGVSAIDVDGDQRPIAYVVPHPSGGLDVDALREWLTERLSAHKRPVAVHVVDEIPRNLNGKLLRRRLADLADATHDPSTPEDPR